MQMRIWEIVNLLLRHPYAGQLTSKGRLRRIGAYLLSVFDFLSSDGRRGCDSRRASQRAQSILDARFRAPMIYGSESEIFLFTSP